MFDCRPCRGRQDRLCRPGAERSGHVCKASVLRRCNRSVCITMGCLDAGGLAIRIFAGFRAAFGLLSCTAKTAGPIAGRAVPPPAAVAGERRRSALPVEVSEDTEKEDRKERHGGCLKENGARLKGSAELFSLPAWFVEVSMLRFQHCCQGPRCFQRRGRRRGGWLRPEYCRPWSC